MTERSMPTWLQKVIAIIAIVSGLMVIVGLPAVVILRYSDAATADRQTQSIEAQRAAVELSNCARSITTERNSVIDARDNAQARVLQKLIATLFVLPEDRGSGGAEVVTLNAELDRATLAVQALPPYDQEVKQRCTPAK